MASLKIVSDRLDDNSIALRVVLEPRRNGEVNFAALEAINRALYVINPGAYDAGEPPAPVIAHTDGHTADGGGIVAHDIAAARLRDLRDDDEGAPGEPPRCKTGGCE
jgi:hypothetical protein